MQIADFTATHIEQAAQIAKQNYEEERGFVPALPPIDTIPDLTPFAENGLGVAAFEGNAMVGFLCAVGPFKNAFRSTDATGVFSPMGVNAAIGENRANIYARMYQAAGEKWARAGAASHGICLYAHDTETQQQFFRYGFGLRCVDAVRGMDEINAPPCSGYDFMELIPDELPQILPLDHMLDAHMATCPTFILRPSDTQVSFSKKIEHFQSVFFVAKHEGKIVAYVRAELDGETFICDAPGYLHIKGAFCLLEHRGKGLHQTLLSLLVQKLKAQGYTRLGVDFESINPTAYGFWLKYFDAYTHSVVRRIDEHVITTQQ
jgi:GNAT superfamily N-acetyltransferase